MKRFIKTVILLLASPFVLLMLGIVLAVVRLGDFLKPRIPVFFHTAIFPGLSPNPTEGLFLGSAC